MLCSAYASSDIMMVSAISTVSYSQARPRLAQQVILQNDHQAMVHITPCLPADHWDWYERIRTYFSEYADEQEAGQAHSEASQEARNLLSQPVRLLMELAGL